MANLTAAENELVKAVLSNPDLVEEWLEEIQYMACAGIIRFPGLVEKATAHIFASKNELFLAVYKAVNSGAKGLEAVYAAVSTRQHSTDSALPLAEMACHPVTKWQAVAAIARLQKFVAWQYRQEKAKKARRRAA